MWKPGFLKSSHTNNIIGKIRDDVTIIIFVNDEQVTKLSFEGFLSFLYTSHVGLSLLLIICIIGGKSIEHNIMPA